MCNVSLGFHTFSFFQRLSIEDYCSLEDDFNSYKEINVDLESFPVKNKKGKIIGFEFYYRKNKGIRWRLSRSMAQNGYQIYGITSTINPKALLQNEYIRAARGDDLRLVERIYNDKISQISPVLKRFGESPLSRADHCINFDVKEMGLPCTAEQLINLFKRAEIPENFSERKVYDEKAHRKMADKNSLYLVSGQ